MIKTVENAMHVVINVISLSEEVWLELCYNRYEGAIQSKKKGQS